MNVQIGIRGGARELQLTLDIKEEELAQLVEKATQSHTTLDLTDAKGQRVIVPADAIGYVSISPDHPQRVGFAVS